MRRVILVILSVGLLLTTYTVVPSKIYAANTTKSKNTLINAWRVTTRGHIYTPVNLNTTVMIRYINQGNRQKVTRLDLSGSVLRNTFSLLGGSLNAGKLVVKGQNISLPHKGTYIYDPKFVVRGKYWEGTKYFNKKKKDSYGTSVYLVSPSKGYQTNSVGKVTWR